MSNKRFKYVLYLYYDYFFWWCTKRVFVCCSFYWNFLQIFKSLNDVVLEAIFGSWDCGAPHTSCCKCFKEKHIDYPGYATAFVIGLGLWIVFLKNLLSTTMHSQHSQYPSLIGQLQKQINSEYVIRRYWLYTNKWISRATLRHESWQAYDSVMNFTWLTWLLLNKP